MSASESQTLEWAGWIAALFGLWILVSPFVLTGSITGGNPYWSNIISGIVVAVLAGYAAYGLRTT